MNAMHPRVKVGITVAVVLAVLGMVVIPTWSEIAFDQLPWQSGPDRIVACDREFGHQDGAIGAGPLTKAYVVERGAHFVSTVKTLQGRREIWAVPSCGVGIYLRTGDDSFLGYGLIGGP